RAYFFFTRMRFVIAIVLIPPFPHRTRKGWGTLRSMIFLFRTRFDDSVHVGISHALGGADHAFRQLVKSDFSVRVNFHDAAQHQAFNVRTQAANVSGEFQRQHGNGAVREINGGSALARFFVNGRAIVHVLGHVGNVDLKLIVAVIEPRDQHGIVKVARGLAVNGHDREVAEVAARGDFLLRDDGVDLLRFFQHLRWENVRDMVLADDHLHVNAEIVFIAENFGDASAGALGGGRPLDDFYFDDDVFQVIPGFALGFFAQDAVWGLAAGIFRSWSLGDRVIG